jgi:hypothetical protein
MPNKGFLLAEDAAVKNRFSNLTVSDDRNASREVQVFFRYPEGETEKIYPFITVEMVGLSHDTRRQLSETTLYYSNSASASNNANYINYYPSELTESEMSSMVNNSNVLAVHSFIPVSLVYQITTHTRSALHDRQLSSKILRRVVPFRQGFIEIPEDGTIRRFDLMSWSTSDLLDRESGYRKRIFRKMFTIQMNAEIAATDLTSIRKVASVVGNIYDNDTEIHTLTPQISEEF